MAGKVQIKNTSSTNTLEPKYCKIDLNLPPFTEHWMWVVGKVYEPAFKTFTPQNKCIFLCSKE